MRATFGRYKISEELGRGGMATVFHAHDPLFGRDVAIKVLPREFLHDPAFRERFEREARAIAQLEHHAIVPVYDFGEEDSQPYLVMRYMSGGSLADLIKQGEISIERVLSITDRLAAALDRAHQKQIIHRDVKPANALFDEDGVVYLSDFGMVRMSEGPSALTGSGIVGTPFYMAPEMSEAGGISHLVDVYALGVTVYQMLTRNLPYGGDTPISVLMGHLNNPVPDIRLVRPGLPEAVQPVMARVLAKSPGQRFQQASEFSKALAAVFSSTPIETRKLSGDQAAVLIAASTPAETAPALESLKPALDPDDPGTQAIAKPPAPLSEQTPAAARTAESPAVQAKKSQPLPMPLLIGGGALALLLILIVVAFVAFGGGDDEEAAIIAEATATAVATEPSTETPAPTEDANAAILALAVAGVASNDEWTPYLQDFDGVQMALVPAGCFQMGIAGSATDAGPAHEQCFEAPFWIDLTEVSQEQFERFGGVAAREPAFTGDDLPQETVNWYEAGAYCAARGGRLPTEAEWEYAARGPESLAFAWGEEFECGRANFDDEVSADNFTAPGAIGCDGYDTTAPVGSYPDGASWVGALDLNGNVWEWVSTWYALYPYSASDGRERSNPDNRYVQTMLRGGAWGVHQEMSLLSGARLSDDPGTAYNFLGFRCAADFEAGQG